MIVIVWIAIAAFWAACLVGGLWVTSRRAAGAGAGAGAGGQAGGRLALRAYPLVIVTLVLAVPFVTLARVENGDSGRSSDGLHLVDVAVTSVVATLVGFILFMIGLSLAGFDPDASQIARRLRGDEASQRLLTRWLEQVRWRRWLGGFLGVVSGVLTLDNGTGWDRVFLLGLTGVAIGSVSAEVHHLRSAGGPQARAADLSQRRFGDYTVRGEELLLAAVAAAAFALLALSLVGAGSDGRWWAVTVLAVVAMVLAFQWRIVSRRRLALPAELREADDLLRHLAVSRGVARPGLAVALALLGEAVGAAGSGVLAGLCWLGAVATWWMSRRLGLDHLLRQPVATA